MSSTVSVNLSVKKPRSGSSSGIGAGHSTAEQNNNELPVVPEDGVPFGIKIKPKVSNRHVSSQTSARKKKRSLRRKNSIEWVLPEYVEPRGRRVNHGTGDYATSTETDRNSSVL
ncbi:unnamed protein product, partial [Allacma fusca]